MKSNLPGQVGLSAATPSVPSGGPTRGAAASGTGALWGDWQSESSAPGQQAFSRWLSQYRSTQAGGTSGVRTGDTPVADRPAAAPRTPVAMARPAAALPKTPGLQAGQDPATPQASAPRPAGRPAQTASSAQSPSAQATARLRASVDADATSGRVTPAMADGSAEKAETPRPVDFTTERGMATAWVQELQPPEGLSLTDPGAVLAWLGALPPAELPLSPAEAGGLPSALDTAQALPSAAEGAWLERSGAAALQAQELMATLEGQAGRQTDTATLAASHATHAEASGVVLTGLTTPGEVFRQVFQNTSEPMRHFTGSLPTPLDNPAFPQALAERVGMWVSGPAQQGPMTAELRLNPQELGPVHVRIELDGQLAQVDFAATHASTREAIEQTLPLLARALESAGLSLSGAGVSDQGGRQAWQGQDRGQGALAVESGRQEAAAAGRMTHLELPPGVGRLGNALGGLDLYA